MELSEAIRRGAKWHPQGFRELVAYGVDGGIVATCALGAARVGLDRDDGSLKSHFPILGELEFGPLPCGCDNYTLGRAADLSDALIHLNDRHRWTRERIASWVRHLERK